MRVEGSRVEGRGLRGRGFRVGACSRSPSMAAFTEMCSGSEVGSYLRLIDSYITQLKAQGPSRTCNESKEEEEDLFEVALDGRVLHVQYERVLY